MIDCDSFARSLRRYRWWQGIWSSWSYQRRRRLHDRTLDRTEDSLDDIIEGLRRRFDIDRCSRMNFNCSHDIIGIDRYPVEPRTPFIRT